MLDVASRVREVRDAIGESCSFVGRSPQSVTVVAACKGFGAEPLLEAFRAGVRDFGENYLQEAEKKRPALPSEAVHHFIGRLQSNKLRRIAVGFDWVHTLDSLEHARALSQHCAEAGREMNVLIEVNIAREASKAGVFAEEVQRLAQYLSELPGLRLRGLMTMGAANLLAESMRPYFNQLRELLESLRMPDANCLSMGMSDDFEVAVQEGATHVRIGSRIFGNRPEKS